MRRALFDSDSLLSKLSSDCPPPLLLSPPLSCLLSLIENEKELLSKLRGSSSPSMSQPFSVMTIVGWTYLALTHMTVSNRPSGTLFSHTDPP